jgi:hypothetical protein
MDTWVGIAQIVAVAVAAVSTILVLLTLKEMKIQRNNAYRPEIVFEPVDLEVTSYSSERVLHIMYGGIPISLKNVGVGVAKNVSLTIDIQNCVNWVSFYNDHASENQFEAKRSGDSLIVRFPPDSELTFNPHHQEKSFLLPNAEETLNLVLPDGYADLFQRISSNIPTKPVEEQTYALDLEVLVSFEDIQGVKYEKKLILPLN